MELPFEKVLRQVFSGGSNGCGLQQRLNSAGRKGGQPMGPFLIGSFKREGYKGLHPKRIRNPDLVLGLCLSIFILSSSALGLVTDGLTWNNFPYPCSTTRKLVEDDGYAFESHKVTTKDGYILEMHHVISTTSQNTSVPQQTVLLQHGLMGNSAHYMLQSPSENCLAIWLAQAGCDVWLGNFRGNCYSSGHTYLDQQSREYWDFSWDELGRYDLPAMFDYVLEYTRSPKLCYIGHSMGTTAGFVLFSEKPEYNTKCQLFVGLAPVCYLTNAEMFLLKLLAPYCRPGLACDLMCPLFSEWGTGKFLLCQEWMSECAAAACAIPFCQKTICSSAICSLCGCSNHTNTDLWDEICCQFMQGSSTKTFVHYAQVRNSDKFRKYDRGTSENLKCYGSPTPPTYSLSKVTTPVFILPSNQDKLSNMKDVSRMANELTGTKCIVSNLGDSGHMDCIFGKGVTTAVNEPILEMIKKTQ
ncbi:unnamed protein product [Allacma fusca]|uniref:Partial AB-hydrolase lipase domain-containing protein n=1 Tax=Allacma fusca TaxID=39272 RepID=A0A8J2PB45_9HEXA|nr:unnamed protein product [Allacma fusca]